MLFRLFSFAVLQGVALLLAYLFAQPAHVWLLAYLGTTALSFLWLAADTWRGLQYLRCLRLGDWDTVAATGHGIWREAAERTRRLLRIQERQSAESEGRLQDFLAAFQASPNGVVLLDREWRIEWFNHTASRHFGLDVQRDLLQHFANLVRDPAFASYVAGKNFAQDVSMPGRDSRSSNPVQLSVQIHPYGGGRSLLLSRDVTAVQQAEAMRRDFVANVSHEIRTPLTVLSGFVETLQTIPLGEAEHARYLGLMAQQADRMQTLVSDLLMLSRLEGSPLPSNKEWQSVPLLMRQCEQEAKDLSGVLWASVQDIRFTVMGNCELAGSASELHSAMFNLIGNAVRYTPVDKVIDVRWTVRADGYAVFSVQDAGLGIAPEHLPRLTERFYRVDRSRSRDTGGTGLGLAIVKHVAQRHEAELVIESVLGKGSNFSIIYPPHRVRQVNSDFSDA